MELISLITNSAAPILGTILGIILGIFPILKDSAENSWKKQFRKQVRLGIIKEQLTYDDMQHIAERWSQDRKAVMLSLRVMHSDAISGEDADLSSHIVQIRELIQKHQGLEPYSELPENISIQLNGLSTKPENQVQVTQLASSLSELYAANQQMLARQVKFTYWGTIAGVIGVLIGVAGLYFAVVGSA